MPPQAPAADVAPARRVFLILLLIAELVGLTLRFDAASLSGVRGWWVAWLSHARIVPEILVATLAAFLVISAGRFKEITGRFLAGTATHLGWWRLAALHLAAFAGLFAVTGMIFEGDLARDPESSWLWFLAWAGLATATLGFWSAAFAPLPSWRGVLKRESGAWAVAVCVGFGAWSAGRAAQALWKPLGDSAFFLAERLLRHVEPDVISNSANRVLGTRTFLVTISPACSGYEGTGMVAVFLAAFLWIHRRHLRFPRAFLLIPVGLVGIWLANVLRITALIILGAHWSRDVAVGGFHSQAGWIAFNLILLGLVATALRLPFIWREKPAASTIGKCPR